MHPGFVVPKPSTRWFHPWRGAHSQSVGCTNGRPSVSRTVSGCGYYPTVATPAHGAGDAVPLKSRLIVLAAIKQQSSVLARVAPEQSHAMRVDDDI